jgi:hypothetical protein
MEPDLKKEKELAEASQESPSMSVPQPSDLDVLPSSLSSLTDYSTVKHPTFTVSYDRYRLKRISLKNPKAQRYLLFLIT